MVSLNRLSKYHNTKYLETLSEVKLSLKCCKHGENVISKFLILTLNFMHLKTLPVNLTFQIQLSLSFSFFLSYVNIRNGRICLTLGQTQLDCFKTRQLYLSVR